MSTKQCLDEHLAAAHYQINDLENVKLDCMNTEQCLIKDD